MARFKMFAHRTLIVTALLGVFTTASAVAYGAATLAVSAGTYAMPR